MEQARWAADRTRIGEMSFRMRNCSEEQRCEKKKRMAMDDVEMRRMTKRGLLGGKGQKRDLAAACLGRRCRSGRVGVVVGF